MAWLKVMQAVIIIVFGIFVLRMSGRRAISQMTISQAVITISLGTLLIGPVQTKNIWITMAAAIGIIVTLIILEYLQLNSDKFETIISGKSVMIIEEGTLLKKNLKILRMTVDHLEMRLRQNKVENIADVKWAAVEPSGHLSFILKDYAKPATKADLQLVLEVLQNRDGSQNRTILSQETKVALFDEIINKSHKTPPDQTLQ